MGKINNKVGNIFNSKADAVVVTVNCIGFMGKGMALECSLRYPEIESVYKLACNRKEVSTGRIMWEYTPGGQFIALFPTKNDYKRPSKLEFISSGLQALVSDIQSRKVNSIAVPRLGSELGGLDWNLVRPLVEQALGPLLLEVELWEFTPNTSDPFIANIIEHAKRNPSQFSLQTGISKSLIDSIIRQSDNRRFSSAVDLLSIAGLGKQGVKKLMSWSRQKYEGDATLF